MKVILIQDVKTVGKEGDVVTVSDGHAQNFLFPQNMAVPATAVAMKRRADAKKREKRVSHKAMTVAGDLAAQLEGHELTIKERASEGGVLYAAVTNKTIAKVLKKDGFNVKPAMVKLSDPIKEPGTQDVAVELQHGFEAKIKIIIEEI